MKVENNKVITLTYKLNIDDAQGELVQEVNEDRPFVHLLGAGTLLPAFENNLTGLSVGDDFAFPIAVGDAYGELREADVVELSKEIFMNEGVLDTELLTLGNVIPMQNEDGHVIEGLVLEVKDDTVVMDFNHPLAGKNLYFSGKVIDVRDALEEEISHGHVHGSEGHQH